DEPARAVFDSERYWLVWGSNQVFFRRVELDGKPADQEPIAVATPIGKQGGASIGFDGERLVVSWHEQTDPADPMAFDVRALRFARDAGVIDAAPIALSAAP